MKHDNKRPIKQKEASKAKREKNSPKAALAARVGLPIDVLSGCPYMQLYGGRLLVIEGNCRILAYDECTLSAACGKYAIFVDGKELCVNLLDKEALAVGGTIRSVCLEHDLASEYKRKER